MTVARTKAALVPLTTDLELRDATIRDYRSQAANLGLEVEAAELERQAIADLELVDAAKREGDIREAPAKKKKPDPSRRRPDELTEQLDKHDLSLRVRDIPDAAPAPRDIADRPAQTVDLKWAAAAARIKRILEPRDRLAGALATTFEAKIAAAAYPELAREYMDVFISRQLAALPQLPITSNTLRKVGVTTRENPFFGLSDVDSERLFRRCVEDICDKSTKHAGLRHWWVK